MDKIPFNILSEKDLQGLKDIPRIIFNTAMLCGSLKKFLIDSIHSGEIDLTVLLIHGRSCGECKDAFDALSSDVMLLLADNLAGDPDAGFLQKQIAGIGKKILKKRG
jgi:hypothetical protein